MMGFDHKMLDEIKEGEHWLATIADAPPPRNHIERIKRAVHAELGHTRANATGQRWAVWHGALASAAAIALAVTVGWLSSVTLVSPTGNIVAETVTTWPDETEQEVVTLAYLDEGLSDLETWTEEQAWDVDGTTMYEAFEEALEDTSNGTASETGASMLWPRGQSEIEEV